MSHRRAWAQIVAEASEAFRGPGRFVVRAYSELMPAPYVGLKPYDPAGSSAEATFAVVDGAVEIDEYEQAHDLEPGLVRVAERLLDEIGKLARGEAHALSHTLLAGNPAWPDELAAAAAAGRLPADPLVLIAPLALSRTQDDKGNDRWTLFGASHLGAGEPFWRSVDAARLAELVAFAGVEGDYRIVADRDEVPAELAPRLLGDGAVPSGLGAVVTFLPFSRLPAAVRRAWLARELVLVPHPATLVWFEHPRYRELAATLPRATQIPLLHVFPRVERSCAIRVPQSGWLDETDPAQAGQGRPAHGHRVVPRMARAHRWERVARDAGVRGDGSFTDEVSDALFSTDPDVIGLYGKPLARNSQIWNEAYELVLDGPRAARPDVERAAGLVDAGGRFGYRMLWLPMRAGTRELFWHAPLVARRVGARTERFAPPLLGHVTAETDGAPALVLAPRLSARPEHVAAARSFPRDPGLLRYTTSQNVRKLLDARALLGEPLEPSYARALLRVARHVTLDEWIDHLPSASSDPAEARRLVATLRDGIGSAGDPGEPLVVQHLGTRGFEETIWRSIAGLAHGAFRQKSNADGIKVNRGKHGGPAAEKAHVVAHDRRDLEQLGDHLHERHRAVIERAKMTGRAEVLDHVFAWETDFSFPWMEGWEKNQARASERNIVVVIPGNNRGEAVIMADHYDTAYMEDVYDEEAGGDGLRAPAAGADDNHSATTALLCAAEALLPLAAAGKLERDVWLVHLTGEEYPADCMGARALAQGLVDGTLVFTAEDGGSRPVGDVRVVGAFVLDMIGHNTDRERDVFQIAPGEGAASARLARRAHRANLRWNRCVERWNRAVDRRAAGRAERSADAPPGRFAHLAVDGEVRVEWEPRSALYNTDGQIFSDLGIPVVLFMENYDISRSGYHDTHDTMANIDLDYCAALTAIAIETVADCACAASV